MKNRNVPVFLMVLVMMAPAWAGTIETEFIEQPWPREYVHELEVGRHPVRWRQRITKQDGLFAGVQCTVPLSRKATWDKATEYQDIGKMTPGVTAVRYTEKTDTRQVIEMDVKILWKTLTMRFEIEQDPPNAVRFRWVDKTLGEYRGVTTFQELPPASPGAPPQTVMALSTWLKPARPVPARLLLMVERITMLKGVETFLDAAAPRTALAEASKPPG